MDRKSPVILILLILGGILSACEPSQVELDAHATEVAASIYRTQTAEAPSTTPTSIPTATPTPAVESSEEQEVYYSGRSAITNQTAELVELLAEYEFLYPVSAITFHPTSSKFAYLVNGALRFFDVGLMETGMKLEGEYSYMTQIAWAPDGGIIAGYDLDGIAWLFHPPDWDEINRLGDESSFVYGSGLAWSPDGEYLAWISTDNTLHIWDVIEDRSVLTETYEDSVWSLSWSPDARYLAVDQATSVTLIDPFTGEVRQTFKGTDKYLSAFPVWSSDSKRLAMADYTDILVWDVDQGTLLYSLRGHSKQIDTLAWSPDGSLIASGSDDETIRLWDPSTGRSLAVFREPKDQIYAIAFSPDGSLLVAGSSYGQLLIWGIAVPSEIAEDEQIGSPPLPETSAGLADLLVLEDQVVVLRADRDETFGIPDVEAWAVPWLAVALPGQVGLEPIGQFCVWFVSEESDGRVAVVYESGTGGCEELNYDYVTNQVFLGLLSWPDLRLTEIINIAEYYHDVEDLDAIEDETRNQLVSAMMAAAVSPPEWSPDGRYLAFVGSIEGPSSDLYLYDTLSGRIIRKTDGPNQALMPYWSPDGTGILHQSVIYFPGVEQEALWWIPLYAYRAVKVQDAEWKDGGMIYPIRWFEDNKLLYIFFDRASGTGPLIKYDTASGQSQTVVDRARRGGAKLSTDRGETVILTVNNMPDQETFNYNLWNALTGEIVQTPLSPSSYELPVAVPPYEQFLVVSDQGLARIQTDGNWEILDPNINDAMLMLSPDERMVLVVEMPVGPVWIYEFWENGEARASWKLFDQPLNRIRDVEWRPDGRAVLLECNVDESYFAVPPEWTIVSVEAGCPAWHGWFGSADNSDAVSLIDVSTAISEEDEDLEDTVGDEETVAVVEVVYTRWFRPDFGGLTVVGEVTNRGSKPVWLINVEVVLKDTDNIVIDAETAYVLGGVLFPGETSPFDAFFYDGPLFDVLETSIAEYNEIEDDDHYILRSNYLDLEIIQQNITQKRVGRYVITGELENVGSFSARSIDVIVTAYDSNGELIGVGFGWPAASVLAPDETSTFKVELSVDGEVEEFKISLNGNREE